MCMCIVSETTVLMYMLGPYSLFWRGVRVYSTQDSKAVQWTGSGLGIVMAQWRRIAWFCASGLKTIIIVVVTRDRRNSMKRRIDFLDIVTVGMPEHAHVCPTQKLLLFPGIRIPI